MGGITPDPKKRSYLLPPGCKDLIDVLERRKKGTVKVTTLPGEGEQPVQPRKRKISQILRADSGTCNLTEIEKYVAMAFDSRESFSLILEVAGDRVEIWVSRTGETVDATAIVQEDTDEEKAARGFLVGLGVATPGTQGGVFLFPQVPVFFNWRLPEFEQAVSLAAFVISFLREVCRLTDKSEIGFSYDEIAHH